MYTHNQLTYGASEIEPELYQDIHSLVKPIIAPNLTLKSDWGEGLKATGEWRAKMEQKNPRGRKSAETSCECVIAGGDTSRHDGALLGSG